MRDIEQKAYKIIRREKGEVSLSEIADELDTTKSNAQYIVNKLVDAGYVKATKKRWDLMK